MVEEMVLARFVARRDHVWWRGETVVQVVEFQGGDWHVLEARRRDK
jgi:hypothetical protein